LEFVPRVGSKACEGCTQGGIPPYIHLRKATEEVEMLGVINIILGGALLVAGRKLFWLFVGAVGFVTGLQFATRIWQGPEGLAIIVGLVELLAVGKAVLNSNVQWLLLAKEVYVFIAVVFGVFTI